MNGSEFQEIYRALTALDERLTKLEELLNKLPCLCETDHSDGLGYCQECGRERRPISTCKTLST